MAKFSKEKEDNIVDLYTKGHNTVEIANLYGTYNTSTRRVLIRRNIEIRDPSKANSFYDGIAYSKEVMSREEQYFLGLLVTDGCISNNEVSISLKEEDKYMVERFATLLGNRVKVSMRLNKKYLSYMADARTKSIILSSHLQKLANFKNKSHDLELYVPITFDILRGIIDGDGSVMITDKKRLVNIVTISIKFANQLISFLSEYGLNVSLTVAKKNRNFPLYSVNISSKKSLLFLYEKLYYSTDLFLERKKNKYGPLLEKSNK